MFDISALKEMKLTELQDIAKASKKIKYAGVKKEALIAEILALQNQSKPVEVSSPEDKPKRARITADKSPAIAPDTLFTAVEPATIPAEIPVDVSAVMPLKRGPKPKFNKAEYEKKQAMKAQTEQAPKADQPSSTEPVQQENNTVEAVPQEKNHSTTSLSIPNKISRRHKIFPTETRIQILKTKKVPIFAMPILNLMASSKAKAY